MENENELGQDRSNEGGERERYCCVEVGDRRLKFFFFFELYNEKR